MKYRLVLHILGTLSMVIGAFMFTPLAWELYYNGPQVTTWLVVPFAVMCGGFILRQSTRTKQELRHREAFAVVTLGWCMMAVLGAIPFLTTGTFSSFADALFESMSGFTTTGASVITDIEALPYGILFWRSLTHWLGGMGIIMLAVAIIPFLGVGGMQLFRAEVPGPVKDRLTPRIASTAKILWLVYVLFTAIEVVLLSFGGMSLFDSFTHTFGTLATGGFSTRNQSIGSFDSVYIELVIGFFMFLAGANFILHYRLLRGDVKGYLQSSEFRFYCGVLAVGIALVTVDLVLAEPISLGTGLRRSLFQILSITTTTGYGTADFGSWPSFSQVLLVGLMFLGGCAGSTGGGMKVLRVHLLLRHAASELRRLIYPGAVVGLKLDGQQVEPRILTTVLTFFFSTWPSLHFPRCSLLASGSTS